MKKADLMANGIRTVMPILLVLTIMALAYAIHTEFIKPLHIPYDKANDEAFNKILLDHNKIFADIVKVIIWPVVALVALVSLHKPLADFLKGMGQRVSKLKFSFVDIELAQVSELKPNWIVASEDVRRVTNAMIFDSPSGELFRQITESKGAQYAVVNLESGRQWVTSRLFIFAMMLERAGLKCFVFLEDTNGVSGRFIGTASPDKVRWALAQHFPWLEVAFAEAYHSALNYAPNVGLITSTNGGLAPDKEREIVKQFLVRIQTGQVSNKQEWIEESGVKERAEWLRDDRLREYLKGVLQDAWVADQDAPTDQMVKTILLKKAPYVALVGKDKKYNSLVDRQELLRDVGIRVAIS